MPYLFVVLTSLLSLVVMFLLSRMIGYRQVSNLTFFDYINSVTIGSIAAEVAISGGDNVIEGVIAMLIYGVFTYACAIITDKNRRARGILTGHPITLMENGKLSKDALRHAHLDMEELTASLRAQGYFDISRLNTVILETSGKISVLTNAGEHPVTPNELELSVPEESAFFPMILDGQIIMSSLERLGRDEKFIKNVLAKEGLTDAGEVLIMLCDRSGSTVIQKAQKS